jgi:hypothetical protein
MIKQLEYKTDILPEEINNIDFKPTELSILFKEKFEKRQKYFCEFEKAVFQTLLKDLLENN